MANHKSVSTTPTRRPPGKTRIREAAQDAIVENGFDLAASRNITAAAGVSTSLLFYHYASLEECLIDAVDASVQQVGERLEIALAGVIDPLDRARLLVEWNLPTSSTQRREWLLSFEFVRAALRMQSVAHVAARQYSRWHETVVREYRTIDAAMDAADAATRAHRLLGLAEGLSWQLILANPGLSENHVREILSGTVAADLGLSSDALLRPSDHLTARLAIIRGE